MKCSNTLNNYTQIELNGFSQRIASFIETLKEVNSLLEKELKTPTKTIDNVISVDFFPKVQFKKLEDVSLEFHEILSCYESWMETLSVQSKLNIGNYSNKKLTKYIVDLRTIILTFQNFLNDSDKKT